MSDNMYDLDGWTKVSCVDSDELRSGRKPTSSLTDPNGNYSAGVVYTEWATEDGTPVLRDYRWTDEARECEHYIPLEES